ncbi:MAG: hypothetical protein AAGA48_28925 [Myxococcota bacterium]
MPRLSVAWTLALVGTGVGASLALMGQAVPPFHVLGHELAQGASTVASVVLLFLSRYARRQFPEDFDAATLAAVAALVGLGCGLHGTVSLANALEHGCETAHTGLFFWLTWGPLGALAITIGLGTAFWPLLRVVAFGAGVVALSVLHNNLRNALHVRVADPLIGELLFLDQRASMNLDPRHVLQRMWLLGVSLVAWRLLRIRQTTGKFDALSIAAGSLLGVGTLAWGGQLRMGFGPGEQNILDGVHQGEHVVIRYDRSGRARHYLPMIEREAEWSIYRLTEAWGFPRDGIIVNLDLYDNDDVRHAITGKRSAFAGGTGFFAAMTWKEALDKNTMSHELVHVLDGLADRHWFADFNRGRNEGSAEAWTEGYAWVPETHKIVAAAARNNRVPPAEQLVAPAGFWAIEENLAYRASGSFMGFLLLEHGVEPWLEWLATRDFEQAYGRPVQALGADWRTFLLELEPDEDARKTANVVFDPVLKRPAIRRQCPKLGDREPTELDRAQHAQRARDYETALTSFRALQAEHPSPYLFWQVLKQLSGLGRHADVLRELEEVDEAAIGPIRVAERRIESLAAIDEQGPALANAIEARLALGPDAKFEDALRLLAVPELAPHIPLALRRDSPGFKLDLFSTLGRLSGAHLEHANDLQALVLDMWGFPKLTHRARRAEARKAMQRALARWAVDPAACDPSPDDWAYLARRLIQMEDCDLANTLLNALASPCEGAAHQWRLDQLRERLRWEQKFNHESRCSQLLGAAQGDNP